MAHRGRHFGIVEAFLDLPEAENCLYLLGARVFSQVAEQLVLVSSHRPRRQFDEARFNKAPVPQRVRSVGSHSTVISAHLAPLQPLQK
jgi:hypothetical protein